jgi:hypothetical protein
MTPRRLAWLALLPALLAGCAEDTPDPPPAPPAASSAPTASAEPQVPTERSDFPDGVYRTELTVQRMRALYLDDPGHAGTWTLTVKAGTFQLECRSVGTPGECGGHDPTLPPLVEVGTLHGTGKTVWFVQDPQLRAKLTGCERHSQRADGCGPEDPYHFDCTADSTSMTCRNYGGLGDQTIFPELSNWTAQPWTRIS